MLIQLIAIFITSTPLAITITNSLLTTKIAHTNTPVIDLAQNINTTNCLIILPFTQITTYLKLINLIIKQALLILGCMKLPFVMATTLAPSH